MIRPTRKFLTIASLLLAGLQHATAATGSQSVTLEPGWNSVWLNVNPIEQAADGTVANRSVGDVFTDFAVTMVAAPYKTVGATSTLTLDTDSQILDRDQWRVWRRNGGKLGLNSLEVVRAHAPYLIYVDPAIAANPITIDITGEAHFAAPRWAPNQYNLVGFGIEGTPSFAEVFAGADGRLPVNRILKLASSGNWVAAAATDTVESGEAYWIFADGKVDYMAPVAAKFPGTTRLDFATGARFTSVSDPRGGTEPIELSLEELTLTNLSSTAQTVGLRQIATTETPDTDELRFLEVNPKPSDTGYDVVREIADASAPLAANATDHVTLGAYRDFSGTGPEREELFQLVLGHVWYWLPMAATDSSRLLTGDADGNSANAFTGLWQGTVLIDQVTTLEQAATRPTTTTLPLKVLIHIDSAGQARLVQQATLMQTKTADESPGEPAIVISPEKLSQFEGIERRGYKLVGQRIETIDYDLPRFYDPALYPAASPDSPGLIGQVIAATPGVDTADQVTAAVIETFVNGRDTRPVELLEIYHQTWPLDGGIGPGQALSTGTTPLTLDPFHRSNPFRHAFHNEHLAGYAISRSIDIIPSEHDSRGRITGAYRETVTGLAKVPIQSAGTIELVRLSEAGTFQ